MFYRRRQNSRLKYAARRTPVSLEPLEPRLVLDSTVVFNEIMYHPKGDEDSLEWIELHNQMAIDMDLSGWSLDGGIDYQFPDGTIIDGRDYLVVAKNPTVMSNQTGFDDALGPFTGRLSNGGEELRLVNNSQRTMNVVDYRDRGDWPVGPDGSGYTLAKRAEVLASHDTRNWTLSAQQRGTPGAENFSLSTEVSQPTTETLVDTGATARVWVPDDGNLGVSWTATTFDDSSWTQGSTGIGYEVGGSNVIAYGNLAGASGSSTFFGALGHDFVVNSPITVTHLGVFDSGADGLTRTLRSEIWDQNSGPSKLATLEFTPSEPGTLVQSNRLKPLSQPLLLSPGDYTIAAHGYGNGERAGDEGFGGPSSAFKSLDDGGGLISFVGTSRLGTSPGSFPSTPVGGTVNQYSAGTFQFTTGGGASGKIGTDIQSEMLDLNTSAYVRIPFPFHSHDNINSMTMTIEYSAGFVAHLNGQEMARRNAPDPVGWNSAATMDAAGFTTEVIDVGAAASALKHGNNVLAIHGLNEVVDASEFLILPELQITTLPPDVVPEIKLAINEMGPGGQSEFFLEIANDSTVSQSVDGFVLASSTGAQYAFPAQSMVAGDYLAVTEAELGFPVADGDTLFLYSTATQTTLVDARHVADRLRGRSPQHEGRWLYPDVATAGAANSFNFNEGIVINEIMYHPFEFQKDEVATKLVAVGDPASILIPDDSSLGSSWHSTEFDDQLWISGPTGVGFEGGGASNVIAYGNLVGASGTANFPGSLGHDFVVHSPITVTHLGVFDSGADGLKRTLTAELWSRSGDTGIKLTDLEFTTADPGALVDSNRLKSLSSPLTLGTGDYSIVAHGYGTGELVGNEGFAGPSSAFKTLDDGGGAISFVGSSRMGVSVGNFPGSPQVSGTVNFYSAGTFQFNTGGAVSGAIATDIATPMHEVNATAYVRIEFPATAPQGDETARLFLAMKYDDGFVAYLNGTEVARRNAPVSPVWNSSATTTGQVLSDFQQFDISAHVGALVNGTNVLAIQGLNREAGDNDFFIIPELQMITQTGVQQEWLELHNPGASSVDLTGWRFDDGISYEFLPGTTIAPGGHLVVSPNPTAMSATNPGIDVVGGYTGQLSNRGERIELVDASGNPVDQVRYYDRGNWPQFADGGGSSLELRDPRSDNSQAAAWAASDESDRSVWNTYTVRGRASQSFGPSNWQELVLGLLDAGEVLLDDITVIEEPGGLARQLIQNGTFEEDSLGTLPASWRIIGNQHGQVVVDPEDPNNQVLHFSATGPTFNIGNKADTTLKDGNTYVTIHSNWEYEVSLRAKWLRGSNQLNSRLYFNRVAKTFLLDVPQGNGTPGTENSAFVENIGPTYSSFTHQRVVPRANEVVIVSVVAEDPDGVSDVRLWWKKDGGSFQSTVMTMGMDGLYTGKIPGNSSGTIVQFYVEGRDGDLVSSTFPVAGADSRALYKVRNNPKSPNPIDTLEVIMFQSENAALYDPVKAMSNQFVGATMVHNNSEVFYDVGVRQRGSPPGRNITNRQDNFRVELYPDHRFRGVHESIAMDGSGNGPTPDQQDEIVVTHMLNRAGNGVSIYYDLVHLVHPLSQHDGAKVLQLARYDEIFLEEQFGTDNGGPVFEMLMIRSETSTFCCGKEGPKLTSPYNDLGNEIEDFGDDKEDYRWQFLIKNQRSLDDYDAIIAMAKAFELSGTDLDEAIEQTIDVDSWMRNVAFQSLIENRDVYSRGLKHNVMFYVRPSDQKVMALPIDMDHIMTNSDAMLHGYGNLGKIVDRPANLRLFYGHMHNFLTTSYNTSYMSPWINHYGALAGQNFGGSLSFISSRSNFLNNRLPSQVSFKINTADPLSVGAVTTATVEGRGWVNVRELRLAGDSQPLDARWRAVGSSYAQTWEVTIPVAAGTHSYDLEAYDYQGNLIATDSIDITSTASNDVSDSLRITEINYNPADPTTLELASLPGLDNDDFEFIEIQNVGTETIELLNVHFSDGIDFTFPSVPLAAGERGVVVQDSAAFGLRYGGSANVLGQFASGRLSNNGEQLTLADAFETVILDFSYGDSDPWPDRADGLGGTLELIDPVGTPTDQYGKYYHWRGSTELGGSPGATGQNPVGVFINEVLTNTDPPLPELDSIELYNATESEIDLGGWYLSDSENDFFKFQIPMGTLLPAGGYRVFDENDFNPTPLTPGPNDFALSGAHGDDVWLVDPDGGGPGVVWLVDDVHFGSTSGGESLGRLPNGSGRLLPVENRTLGGGNSRGRVGPLVISEVHYSPENPSASALAIEPDLVTDDLEFIEVYNPTNTSVDLTNWRIRGGIDYDFAAGTMLGAKQTLVVISFNPENAANQLRLAALRDHYGIDSSVPVVGGYQNRLSDSGQRVQLQRPDTPPLDEPLFVPHLHEDEVLYDNLNPWPTAANGTGVSLHRTRSSGLGSDAASWTASTPMPGRPLLLGDNDLDGDVDTSDLTNAIVNFTSAGGVGKTWADGDTDGDGDVDTSDLTEAIINFTGAAASASIQGRQTAFARSLILPLETWLSVNDFTEDKLQPDFSELDFLAANELSQPTVLPIDTASLVSSGDGWGAGRSGADAMQRGAFLDSELVDKAFGHELEGRILKLKK